MQIIKKYRKIIIMTILFIAIYGWVFWYMIDGTNTINTIIASISWYMISLMIRSLLSLQIRQIKIIWLLPIGLVLSCLWYIFSSVMSRWMLGALAILHASYRLITYNIRDYTDNSIRISWWWMSVGLYTGIALCMSIGYSMLIMGYNQVSWLDCLLLRNASMRVIEQISTPLTLGTQQIIGIKDSIAWRFTDAQNQSGITLGSVVNFSGNSSLSIAGIPLFSWWLISRFFNERKDLDLGTCDYTLSKLKEIYARPNTQITFIVSLTILMMLFINIIIWIWIIITWIILSIIARLWFFEVSQTQVEKEMIE